MTLEPRWLTYAKRLQAIASTGMYYCRDAYDRERYMEVAGIANEMLALLGDVPVERIEGLIPDFARGYTTPKVDVRAAIIRDDAILLVRERDDGLWSLPGGFAEVGLSPARNVAKEVSEETGLIVDVRRLYRVRHSAGQPDAPDVRDFYKMFFLCEIAADAVLQAGPEVEEARFFARGALPELSTERILASDIDAAFAAALDEAEPVLFD